MPKNRQRLCARKIQECARAFSIIEAALQNRLGVEDLPFTAKSLDRSKSENDEKLLSTKRVSNLLGVSEKTLANWRCSGTQGLSHVKVGSRIFYRSSDVHAFILNNSKQSTSDNGGYRV